MADPEPKRRAPDERRVGRLSRQSGYLPVHQPGTGEGRFPRARSSYGHRGRNNTGKTYITDSLYGFLKTWEDWPGAPQCLFEAPSDFPSINGIAETLLRKRRR